MENTKKTQGIQNKVKHYIRITALLLCTAIAGYGILTAPESDEDDMKQELLHNQQLLQSGSSSKIPGTVTAKHTAPSCTSGQEKTPATGQAVSVIGDSVFLGAAPSFRKIRENAAIDAKISRQVRHGIGVARKMKKEGRLGDTVIISLGTNGCFNPATGQELIDYIGPGRTIYWINAYGKHLDSQQEINRTIRALCAKNSNVRMISWAKEAKKHPDWFYQDGCHLNPQGQDGFAGFVQEQITAP